MYVCVRVLYMYVYVYMDTYFTHITIYLRKLNCKLSSYLKIEVFTIPSVILVRNKLAFVPGKGAVGFVLCES